MKKLATLTGLLSIGLSSLALASPMTGSITLPVVSQGKISKTIVTAEVSNPTKAYNISCYQDSATKLTRGAYIVYNNNNLNQKSVIINPFNTPTLSNPIKIANVMPVKQAGQADTYTISLRSMGSFMPTGEKIILHCTYQAQG